MPAIDQCQVTITDKGYAYFGSIQFTKKTTADNLYKFTIKEIIPNPGTGGYTYDIIPGTTNHYTDPWTLEVEIADNDQGELYVSHYKYYRETADVTEETSDGAAIITQPHAGDGAKITNKYKPKPIDYTIPIEKTITTDFGPTVQEKTFTFELKALDGTLDGSIRMANRCIIRMHRRPRRPKKLK